MFFLMASVWFPDFLLSADLYFALFLLLLFVLFPYFVSLSLLSVFYYCISHGFLAFQFQPISTSRFFVKALTWFPLILVSGDLYCYFPVSAELYFALFSLLCFVLFPCFFQPIATFRFLYHFFRMVSSVFNFSRSLLCIFS